MYQEDVIKFLQQICGFSGSDADNARRTIARKKPEDLEKILPDILKGYCEKSPQPQEVAEQEAKEFLQIISDASSYMFGYNHSVGYCMIGYLCAYLRYYHPFEFITAYLNNANGEDDVKAGKRTGKALWYQDRATFVLDYPRISTYSTKRRRSSPRVSRQLSI